MINNCTYISVLPWCHLP